MPSDNLIPDKIEDPIQLMAAWFVMLVSLTTVLLATASNIKKPEWAAGYLVVSSSIVIIIVIGCVFLMLTKFRANLQGGKEYAQWIKDQGEYSKGEILQPQKMTGDDPINKDETSDIKNIYVSVLDAVGGLDIVESLKNKGFNVDLHPYKSAGANKAARLNSITGSQEAIWLGVRVEADIAILVIKIAIKVWPALKYIMIPSDTSHPPDHVNDQIFIGGSSKTAIKQGIQTWSINEFMALPDDMKIGDFHQTIRGKYRP